MTMSMLTAGRFACRRDCRPYNDMFYDLMIKKGIRGGKGFKRWTGWRESFEDEMATPRSKRDLKMVPKAS